MATYSDNPPCGEINGSLTADSRWYVTSTGGNCEAWERVDGGYYWWITAEQDPSLPEHMYSACLLGLYTKEGKNIGTWDCATVWHALSIANGMTEGN